MYELEVIARDEIFMIPNKTMLKANRGRGLCETSGCSEANLKNGFACKTVLPLGYLLQ